MLQLLLIRSYNSVTKLFRNTTVLIISLIVAWEINTLTGSLKYEYRYFYKRKLLCNYILKETLAAVLGYLWSYLSF